MAAGGKKKTGVKRKGRAGPDTPPEGNFLAAAREAARQENEKKRTARTNKDAAERDEELRLDSIVGDEPPKSEAEFQRRKRQRTQADPLWNPRSKTPRPVTRQDIAGGGKEPTYKKGGCVGDGCAIRGRTKGTMR